MTPNGFAYLVLALWPIVTFVIFRQFPAGRALIISLLAGYLLLPPSPTEFDLPLIPPLDKETIPSLSALLAALIMHGRRLRLLPGPMLAKILLILFVISPMPTALANGHPVVNGAFYAQALGMREGLSMMVDNALLAVPFVLAMNFLKTAKDQRDILFALLVSGLAYSLPMLLEVRLSPQLNTWIYGFFQHSFAQMIREGGFRPIVFLYHGLWVAFFTLMALIAAVTLFRHDRKRDPKQYLMAGAYLFFVLVLCKSLGPLVFSLFLMPLILFLSLSNQVRIALVLMILALTYPVLKGNGMIPEREILQQAEAISAERAQSLHFRLVNEALLLDRALVKPIFGWGEYGRALVHDTQGRLLTIPDGRWVIVLGKFGWVGYIAEFGLLALAGFVLWRNMGRARLGADAGLSPWIGGLALLLGINMIDMLPNATLTPLTWMLSGSILGYAATTKAPARRRRLQAVMR